MTPRLSTTLLAIVVALLGVAFVALTIADAATRI